MKIFHSSPRWVSVDLLIPSEWKSALRPHGIYDSLIGFIMPKMFVEEGQSAFVV
jgi:hypothetical protein